MTIPASWAHALVALLFWWTVYAGLAVVLYRTWPARWNAKLRIAIYAYTLFSWLMGTLALYTFASDDALYPGTVPSNWEYTWNFGLFALIWPAVPFLVR